MLQFQVGKHTINIKQLILLPIVWGLCGLAIWADIKYLLVDSIKNKMIDGILLSIFLLLIPIAFASVVTYVEAVCWGCKRFFSLKYIHRKKMRCTFCGHVQEYQDWD